MPKAAKFGIAAALLLAAFYLMAALWSPVTALPPTLVLLATAFGIWKSSAWSGYGGALFICAQAGGLLVGFARFPNPLVSWGALAFILCVDACAAFLLFWAGRSLAGRQPSRSRPTWIALAAATFLLQLILQPFSIPTGAMEDTLLIGDSVLVRIVGPSSPSRGDLVVFQYPVDPRQTFVKRVVAAGGDKLRIKDKKLFVNGVARNEPYAVHKTSYIDAFRDNFPSQPNVILQGSWAGEMRSNMVGGELLVPPGKLFVMGDNRDASLDSRYWGFLDPKSLIGKPVLIYFSVEPPKSAGLPSPALLNPGLIRWRRMFKVL
jgi:signal peptidase I